MKSLKAFFQSLNILRVYREERERDREVLLACVREASTVLQGATQVLLEQQKLMTSLLGSYQQAAQEPTKSWTISPEQDVERVAAGLGMTLDDYLKAI